MTWTCPGCSTSMPDLMAVELRRPWPADALPLVALSEYLDDPSQKPVHACARCALRLLEGESVAFSPANLASTLAGIDDARETPDNPLREWASTPSSILAAKVLREMIPRAIEADQIFELEVERWLTSAARHRRAAMSGTL